VAPPVATPERQAPRAFVPPPGVTTTRNGVAARSDAPAPDAPQLAASVNTLAAGLPELNLPVPKAPQNAVRPAAVQAGAAPKFEEYIGPRAIRSVQPSFDASANRTIDNAFSQNHEPHEVQVEVTIDEHGRVTKASKGATTGPFAYLFVDAALAAARRWQFEPASLGGRPVPSKMTLKFAFVRNR
jgi:TonB family protein